VSDYQPGRRVRRRGLSILWSFYFLFAFITCSSLDGDARSATIIVLGALPFAYGVIRKSIVARFNAVNRPGLEQLRDDPADAERTFAEIERRFRWPRYLRRISAYNRAIALLKQGQLDEAVGVLVEVEQHGGVIGLDAAIAANLAYLHALCGRIELAEAWQAEVSRRAGPQPGLPHVLTDIAIELRKGHAAELRNRLDDQWRAIEAALTGARLRPVRVLRAFAIAQSSDIRDAGAVEPALAALRPARYAEFAYLGKQWPELDQFLRANLT